MKVLIVGLGSIAKKHIKSLNKAGVHEIFALRSSRKSLEYKGVTSLYSIDEISRHNFDFFLISNITSKHFETIKDLIQFKKPLFIEKPLFADINAENKALVEEIIEKQIVTYIGCTLRFLESLKEIRELIKNCRINEVNIYSGSYLPNWRPNINFRNSYSAQKELGGGVHIDLIHELDYLYWVLGDPEIGHSNFSNKSHLKIDAVDYANYIFEYKNFTASVILNYYRLDTKRTFEIITSEGTFLVDLISNQVFKNNEEIFSSTQTIADTLDAQMEFFLQEILTGKEPNFNNVNEAYKVLELCLKD